MKRFISGFLTVLLLCVATGCGQGEQAVQPRLRIVTTIFPIYDWVREILGEMATQTELTLLLDDGVDLHSYAPTVEDMSKITVCDLFLYVGGSSDKWVQHALKQSTNPKQQAFELEEAIRDRLQVRETVEGMQIYEDNCCPADGYDEHVWLSLKNAVILCGKIADTLGAVDPENAQTYRENADAYIRKLQTLDAQYTRSVQTKTADTLIFADRFPFLYLVKDYGLSYYAAFSGCAAEVEASFETVVFLAQKADALQLRSILTLEKSDGRIAQTVRENTKEKNQQILSMDSLQSVTDEDVAAGTTYLGIMQQNLAVLRQALASSEVQQKNAVVQEPIPST